LQFEAAEARAGFRSRMSEPRLVKAFGFCGVAILLACLAFQFAGADH